MLKEGSQLLSKIPGVISASGGPNYTKRGKGYNYGISMVFESKEAEAAYQVHPDHVKFVKERVRPALSKASDPVLAVDFEDMSISTTSTTSSPQSKV
eukprot:jgi/Bigna1/140344/aug1.55_g15052